MPFTQTVYSSPDFSASNRIAEDFEVYRSNEPELPPYVPNPQVASFFALEQPYKGLYLETEDRYITPVGKCNERGFRLAASSFYSYSVGSVANGRPLLYHIPSWWKQHQERDATEYQMRRFVWTAMRRNDSKRAFLETYPEYRKLSARSKNRLLAELYNYKPMRKHMSQIFQRQIKDNGKSAASFAIDRIEKMQDRADKILDRLAEKLEIGEATDAEVELFLKLTDQAHKIVEANSEMLGYKGEKEEFSMQVKGKRLTSGYQHMLPNEIASAEAEEAPFEEVDDGQSD